MAYLRYGVDCEWYVFWYGDKAEAEQAERTGYPMPREQTRLAVWHAAHQADGPILTYTQVRAILDTDDLSQIPGFEPSQRDRLRTALAEFVSDVDAEYDGSRDH
jgi:hypothetical protein